MEEYTMNSLLRGCCAFFLLLSTQSFAADIAVAPDLKKAVPVEAHLAIFRQHNPDRDYQREYWKQVWQTAEDEKLAERIVALVTSQIPSDKLESAQPFIDELRAAAEPVTWQTISSAKEAVYAQLLEMPTNQHLVLLRLTAADAENCATALNNVFALVERRAGDKAKVVSQSNGGVELKTLEFIKEVPFNPTVARVDDVLVFSSSREIANRSVSMLLGSGEPSKFDDPRLREALTKLPEPKDALVFFDGNQMFAQMRKMGDFIRQQSHDDPNAKRVSAILDRVIGDFAILDCEVTSEYTDGNRNCTETLGKLSADYRDKLLGRMIDSAQPFSDWQKRIPSDATAYSLSTGVSLHPLYEEVLRIIREDIPEAVPKIDQFIELQEKLNVDLDRDILQAFSGQSISVSLPIGSSATADASAPSGIASVTALRCEKPDRIRELLHRGADALQELPAIKAQQLKLVKCDDPDGFDEISAAPLAAMGVRPVVGFHEGWMIFASNPTAVQKLIATWSGGGSTIDQSEAFQRFGLKVVGPVDSIRYCDLAAQTRRTAQKVRQLGVFAPMVIGLIGAKANAEQLKTLQDAAQLLPSLAKVIEQCDFLQAKLTVVQPGDTPGTYRKHSVVLVRPPDQHTLGAHSAEVRSTVSVSQ
jgi:hypothetical protein